MIIESGDEDLNQIWRKSWKIVKREFLTKIEEYADEIINWWDHSIERQI